MLQYWWNFFAHLKNYIKKASGKFRGKNHITEDGNRKKYHNLSKLKESNVLINHKSHLRQPCPGLPGKNIYIYYLYIQRGFITDFFWFIMFYEYILCIPTYLHSGTTGEIFKKKTPLGFDRVPDFTKSFERRHRRLEVLLICVPNFKSLLLTILEISRLQTHEPSAKTLGLGFGTSKRFFAIEN